MKNLSIEEKAKRYDEALAMAKECITYVPDEAINKYMLNMFPELKELEDEKIRKQIISFLKESEHDHYRRCLDFSSWIAWLEKQGKQNVDKVEPKFKVGDWIVFNGLTLYINEVVKGYYKTISKGGMPNSYDWNIDNVARLWTLNEAKDGDVLVHSSFMFDDFIFIYNNTSNLQAYCYYSKERNKFIIEDRGHYCPWNMQEVKPATKEQQDFLFQRMKKDGYEFDAYEKVLNKVIIYESKKKRNK